jgi:hypothetical protein
MRVVLYNPQRMAEQRKRRYKQFAGFPGASGAAQAPAHGHQPTRPLTDTERADMERAGIPRDPQPPAAYTPPPAPYTRRIGIELVGPLGLLAVVLFLFGWLLSVPASGEHSYYGEVLDGEITHIEPVAVSHGDHDSTHANEAHDAHADEGEHAESAH